MENQKELTNKADIGWGHQIRSYVLQPYQLVKDLRNKTENTNPSSVLDGNIDQFIDEGIKIKKSGNNVSMTAKNVDQKALGDDLTWM